jgi:hypothetical protein
MTDIIREQSKWAKERTKVITEYMVQNRTLFNTVAGRGFTGIPGFLYDMQNEIELGIKFKLSDANTAILTETIERELKAAGIFYDLAFKAAQLEWELSKQDLLGDWELEYSGIKQGLSNTEESLIRAEIAVQARQAILITMKTAIEVEAEGYRKQIADLADDSADYEVTLAQKKMLTANKKLEMLPVLNQIISAETSLIAAEQGKIAKETALVAKLQEVAAKKQELIPLFAALVAQMTLLATALTAQTGFLIQVMGQKLLIAEADYNKAVEALTRAATLLEIEDVKTTIEGLKINIDRIKQEAENELLVKEAQSVRSVSSSEESNAYQTNQDNRATGQAVVATKLDSISADRSSRVAKINHVGDSDVARITLESANRDATVRETADISAITNVTAQLAHLLSM